MKLQNNIYQTVKVIFQTARDKAYKQIVKEKQKCEDSVKYASYLFTECSKQSLWNMRLFYSAFPILSVVRRELSWTHYKMVICLSNEIKKDMLRLELNKEKDA